VANGVISVSSNAAATSFLPASPNTTFAPNMIQPSAGGGLPHENQQPYLGINFCIALQGVYPSFP
jgi:microcystin-dependent protein